jgi:AraC-like DNA-binding protein
MIKEKSSYADDLPVNIRIAEIEEYPLHFHQDVEFVYVLKGEINVKCGYFTYRINEGNVFTINGREVHGIYRTDQPNITALIQIDNYFFSHYFNRLSGSCFRTFTSDKDDDRMEALRIFFAKLLMESIKREPGHKSQIINLVIQLLGYLNEYFHYFSFENKVVVNARNDNPVFVERLGRIISYIYENHAKKLTLENLSELEHLSTYYLSHLIAEVTGMNFREFLCFARVEFSEMALLDTDKKINAIAQEVGFSATSYYIKYFKKWFGMTPSEYRNKFGRDTKAPNIPAKLAAADPGAVSRILRRCLEEQPTQIGEVRSADSFHLDLQVDCEAAPLGMLQPAVVPRCSGPILNRRFDEVLASARELGISEIIIVDSQRNEERIGRLEKAGIRARHELPAASDRTQIFGLDSIAAAPFLLKQGLNPGCREISINSLIDADDDPSLLKGCDGIFTSELLPKPSFFAYKMLGQMQGELIHWGKYHAVVRRKENGGNTKDCETKSSFCIVCYNHNEESENLCRRPSSIEETLDRIGSFNGSLDIGIRLSGIFGAHRIMIYRLSHTGSLMDHMVRNGISRSADKEENQLLTWSATPKTDISTEILTGSMFLSISLKGPEAQCIIITPV